MAIERTKEDQEQFTRDMARIAARDAHAVSVRTRTVTKCGTPGCSVCDETSEEYMARKGFKE